MVKFSKIKSALIFFTLALSLYYCANQLPPDGGEIDKIAPEVIYVYPENGTTLYDETYFEIEFSEYVDKRSFRDALFISPAIEGDIEIDWTGTTVTVEFPEGLKDSVTYVVSIGTDVVDLNNKNRMASTFTFSFATGDKIDKRKIDGRVYGKDTEGTLIFAYKFLTDTSNYLLNKPDYVSQTGIDGKFLLEGLAESVYRIFAVKDEFRDLIFQADQDLIGIPANDVSLTGADTIYTGMNFFLSKADTLKPRIIEALMTDLNHILVRFSEEFDSSISSADNFSIIDSTTGRKFNIIYAYKGSVKKEELVLVPDTSIVESSRLYLLANKIIDLNKNLFKNDFTTLLYSSRKDTSGINITSSVPKRLGKSDFEKPEMLIQFDDAFNKDNIKSAVTLADTSGNKVLFTPSFPDDATMMLKPLINLKPETQYLLKIDLSKFVDIAGNKIDSVYEISFTTISGIEFTGLSGKVSILKQNFNLILEGTGPVGKRYHKKVSDDLSFDFERIDAGGYLLWGYEDSDSNSVYDFGWHYPFRFAEKFYFYNDTLNLRPRWSLTDVLFKVE